MTPGRGGRSWWDLKGRAGRAHRRKDRTRVVVPGTNPSECRGCGAPGPSLCVCDWDGLTKKVLAADRARVEYR